MSRAERCALVEREAPALPISRQCRYSGLPFRFYAACAKRTGPERELQRIPGPTTCMDLLLMVFVQRRRAARVQAGKLFAPQGHYHD
jgi:hypothetical protein